MKSLARRTFAGMRILALVIFLLAGITSSATTINSAVISGTQLTITGTGFSGTPLAVTFNGKTLLIVSSSSTQIVATLNPVPAPGSYRLVVKSGTASTFAYVVAPTIVARIALVNQTAAIPTTTLFTPTSDGLYRISAYGAITTPVSPNGANWSVFFGWTDEAGMEGSGEPLVIIADFNTPQNAYGVCTQGANGTQSPAGCVLVVRSLAGKPLTYSVTAEFAAGGTYELFITVEQLM